MTAAPTLPRKPKLYCYVDESGQDTKGRLFIVAVVITASDADSLRAALDEIERSSGKGRVKWMSARDDARLAYIRRVLSTPAFIGKLYYSFYPDTIDYVGSTVYGTVKAIKAVGGASPEAVVFVDGLPKSRVSRFASELRSLGVSTRKVRGVRKEESDELMRLADALAGFTRAVLSGREDLEPLLAKARQDGFIKEV